MVQAVAADRRRCRPARSAGGPAKRLAGRVGGTGPSAADTPGTRGRDALHCARPTDIDGLEGMNSTIKVPDPFPSFHPVELLAEPKSSVPYI